MNASSNRKRVLFVDDEPNVLQGLRRMLRPYRNEWEMEFAENGQDALALMDKAPFDVVVSDMRMPGMDGAQLLTKVMERHPHTIRIVLSGQSDIETVYRSVHCAHQYLAKPSDAETIKTTIGNTFSIRNLIDSVPLQTLVSQIDNLPSLPALYTAIEEELRTPNPSLQKVGEIIEQDAGMSAKVLQLVNSAFFGLPRHISSPSGAVNLLGLETVKSLVLMTHVFNSFEKRKLPQAFSLDSLWKHNMAVGAIVREMARELELPAHETDHAYIAALLHDCGKLIFAANLTNRFCEALEIKETLQIPLYLAEKQVMEANHAEVGAYLLGLWGMPDPVIEAVAYHHDPSRSLNRKMDAVAVVCLANLMAHDLEEERGDDLPQAEAEALAAHGLAGQWSKWRKQFQSAELTE